jgi:hypothetical protein
MEHAGRQQFKWLDFGTSAGVFGARLVDEAQSE